MSKPVCDCESWGENRLDELYMDVGCVMGYAECKHEQCPNYQKIKKAKRQTTETSSKCLSCGSELAEGEEYVCDGCFRREMQKDIEWHQQHPKEVDDREAWGEDWRFKDSRGRSVFKRD